ncbi:MAG: hypothetical protein SV422_01375, partial [Pseudomonadota bacterium]|nr:hypothetical protein [Pseudomonadota bacterium]
KEGGRRRRGGKNRNRGERGERTERQAATAGQEAGAVDTAPITEATDLAQDQGGDNRPRAGRRPPEKRGAHQPRPRQRGPREDLQLDGNVAPQSGARPEAVTTAVSDSVIAPLAAAEIADAALSNDYTQPAPGQETASAGEEMSNTAVFAAAQAAADAPRADAEQEAGAAPSIPMEEMQFTMPAQVSNLMAEAATVETVVESPIGEEVSNLAPAPTAAEPAEAEPAEPVMSGPITSEEPDSAPAQNATATDTPAPAPVLTPEQPRERRRAPNDPRNRM